MTTELICGICYRSVTTTLAIGAEPRRRREFVDCQGQRFLPGFLPELDNRTPGDYRRSERRTP